VADLSHEDSRPVIIRGCGPTNTYEAAALFMVDAADLAKANRAELLGQVAGAFSRRETWTQAGKYVNGLMADLPRKNGWTLAEHAGDRSPDRMQRLLNHAVWDGRPQPAGGLERAPSLPR
jgi:hypothetical protein